MAGQRAKKETSHEADNSEDELEPARMTETCAHLSWPPSSTCQWPAGDADACVGKVRTHVAQEPEVRLIRPPPCMNEKGQQIKDRREPCLVPGADLQSVKRTNLLLHFPPRKAHGKCLLADADMEIGEKGRELDET